MTSLVQSNNVRKEDCEPEVISSTIEMISEEKMPSILTLSMTNSMSSNSTFDLDASTFEQTEEPISMKFIHPHSKHDSAFLLVNSGSCNSQICEQEENVMEQNASRLQNSDLDKSTTNNFRKCMSLHDVSHIQPFQLSAKSLNTTSCETVHSQSLSSTTKSKDSGFQRSFSCLSFGSGRKNYNHVESKVKAYIRNIKESEANRKKNKVSVQNEPASQSTSVLDDVDIILDKKELLLKIQELKNDLKEKALYIDIQQKNYNSLLLRLAEAKNTIDKLRLERISLDYSTTFALNNSQFSVKSNHCDFQSFEYEQDSPPMEKCHIHKSLARSDQSSAVSSHDTNVEPFKPSKSSTPKRIKSKKLNPICKIFSSSLRLGSTKRPLKKLLNIGNSTNNSTCQAACSSSEQIVKYNDGNSKKPDHNCLLVEQHDLKQEFTNQPRQIDLPNDDPFDKVKKWQASLPNLNLLDTNSSSDGELIETQGLDQNRANYRRSALLNFKENEINGFLSEELVAKCKISEKRDKLHHYNLTSGLDEASRVLTVGTHFDATDKNNDVISGKSYRKCRHIENKRQLLNRLNDSGTSVTFPQEENTTHEKDPITKSCNQFYCSACTSQSNPAKSTSPTLSVLSDLDNGSFGSDCCESYSISSDLSSEPMPSKSKLSKRHYNKVDKSTPSKIPKPMSKKTCSKFVLREPKLNINSLFTVDKVDKESKLTTENNSACTKSSSCDPIKSLKAESSQRKAWNSRNNTNFNVCKEFYFKKSGSLEDCFHAIEGMTQKASSIIGIALDRSNY